MPAMIGVTRRKAMQTLLSLGLTAIVAGCGFQLRGQSTLPFEGAYVDAPDGNVLGDKLRKHLTGKGKLQGSRDKAQVVMRLSGENRSKSILSLSGAGKVREYRIVHKVIVSATTPAGQELLQPSELQLARDYSYSDAQFLAKEAEEAMLQREMEDELVRQMVRRMGLIRLP